MNRVRAVALTAYGPEASWRHILIDVAKLQAVVMIAYGALVCLFGMPEAGAVGVVVVGVMAVLGIEAFVSNARWRRRHRAYMLALTCEAIRAKARADAEAGRLLGTLDGVYNWLRLREVPEDQVENLVNMYVDTYDETTGLGLR
jgi:hypothetical protein